MSSNYETFFQNQSFAVVGHSAMRAFPKLTYGGLKKMGKKVYAVDPSVAKIEGDATYADLDVLPDKVDAVVLEIPKEETQTWVEKAAAVGVKNLWMHMNCETPQALALARKNGINARHGTCAVMYVTPGLTYHAIHRGIMKLLRKY